MRFEAVGEALRDGPVVRSLEIVSIAQLEPRKDGGWTEALHGDPVDAALFGGLQHIITVGSINPEKVYPWIGPHLEIDGLSDEEMLYPEKVIEARKSFYDEGLGWGDPNHEFHDIYIRTRQFGEEEHLHPGSLTSFVEVMRILDKGKVELTPEALGHILTRLIYQPEEAEATVRVLTKSGFTYEKIFPDHVEVVALDYEELHSRIERITTSVRSAKPARINKRTVKQIVDSHPDLLLWSKDEFNQKMGTWRRKINNLGSNEILARGSRLLEVDWRELPERRKRVERMLTGFINHKWELRGKLSLDADTVISEHPDVLCLSEAEADFFEHFARGYIQEGHLQAKPLYVYGYVSRPVEEVFEEALRKVVDVETLALEGNEPARVRILGMIRERLRNDISPNERDAIRSYLRFAPLDYPLVYKFPELIVENAEAEVRAPRPEIFPGSYNI